MINPENENYRLRNVEEHSYFICDVTDLVNTSNGGAKRESREGAIRKGPED